MSVTETGKEMADRLIKPERFSAHLFLDCVPDDKTGVESVWL
jgi:hypothetical protein